ncbi:hypothetical protein HRbin36_01629 [bacterium HR36]|nr:hypothetical protein HRbin36_01629 [bacterium HR36]
MAWKWTERAEKTVAVMTIAAVMVVLGCHSRVSSRDSSATQQPTTQTQQPQGEEPPAARAGNSEAAAKVQGEPAFQGIPLSHWLKQLRSEEADKRKEALRAISAIGPAAKEAIPEVRKLLQDPDEDVQEWACSTLGRIGEAAKVAIPDLEKIILNRQAADKVRWAAAVALGNIGPVAVSATPTLLKALQDSDPWLRWAATEGLSGIGPQAQGAAQALAEALYDTEYIVRIGAARALVHVAPQVKQQPKVVSALIRCYEDSSQYDSVRQKVAEAIKAAEPGLAAKLGIK